MKPILEIRNVSKKFRILHEQDPYLNIRESLVTLFKPKKYTKEEFYALKDVSFSVAQGESLGIVGRNGAGKSTLLKILSKITPPSSGSIIERGRTASLLEVGTGFHPELTGRENIFLNGSILGMRRREIVSKFDEIVDFSGVEKFLDTPLKRYSSGMQLRLAFSVAAFLEPEILIIDEVLAVGDAEFQKKCMGKMESVAKTGRTILFVSHNLAAITNLCSRVVMLKNGQVDMIGDPYKTVSHYLDSNKSIDQQGIRASITYDNDSHTWEIGSKIKVEFEWDKDRMGDSWEADLAAYTYDNIKLFALQSNKFDGSNSSGTRADRIAFTLINPGFTHNDIRIDFGIRLGPQQPYNVVINNLITVNTGIVNLPSYDRNDVILVPKCTIEF
jgi:ABC-type polysaccharide/polyol phosphate transport system ATPase subunit